MKSVLVFLLQSIVAGLAVAFVVVLLRPDLLPDIASRGDGTVMSYADAVELSAPAVANIYTKRLVQTTDERTSQARFRIDTAFASAVILDAEGYLQPSNVRHAPLATARRGIFFVGRCHQETDDGESAVEAEALAQREVEDAGKRRVFGDIDEVLSFSLQRC